MKQKSQFSLLSILFSLLLVPSQVTASFSEEYPPVFAVVSSVDKAVGKEALMGPFSYKVRFIGDTLNASLKSLKVESKTAPQAVKLNFGGDFAKIAIHPGDVLYLRGHYHDGLSASGTSVQSTTYTVRGVLKSF